jgi:hypothetical protein
MEVATALKSVNGARHALSMAWPGTIRASEFRGHLSRRLADTQPATSVTDARRRHVHLSQKHVRPKTVCTTANLSLRPLGAWCQSGKVCPAYAHGAMRAVQPCMAATGIGMRSTVCNDASNLSCTINRLPRLQLVEQSHAMLVHMQLLLFCKKN